MSCRLYDSHHMVHELIGWYSIFEVRVSNLSFVGSQHKSRLELTIYCSEDGFDCSN